ncbi:divergent polysaccharide deacetylase family protein [Pseudomaricurvus alkylphenolicus]|uniref:divergent polysaccharide deacetylase family protein n=1 Tax=Pseudomaricurvus alkylphenolicus TaxID=1306991 RepID=UPI00141EAE9A|nr:divergent polysaccharide deacetylase family protein [Pseudomaricurvus alkylphenolicus]NIB39664.1 divergent polysaccharide deacetylase family protein [Pseudomaricurvus alkylphenolicus]
MLKIGLLLILGIVGPTLQAETAYPPNDAKPARIAIIIDDLGYNLSRGLTAARFPGALTLAVLPHSPNGVALAELGYEQGKEIMLHAPMSTLKQRPLDPGGLTPAMTHAEFVSTLRNNLAAIPHVTGLNNHMGSHLTQLVRPMAWLMMELRRENLFFVDSRTSPGSIAWETAQREAIPSLKRDIFLDNVRQDAAIEKQLRKLILIASERGWALAIGHPYPETLSVLKHWVPELAGLGIELVGVSQLLPSTASEPLSEPAPVHQSKIAVSTAGASSEDGTLLNTPSFDAQNPLDTPQN